MLKNWELIEKYGTEELQIFQVISEEKKTIIKVLAGEVGFYEEFDNPKDPLISRIIKFCKEYHFVMLDKITNVESFFK